MPKYMTQVFVDASSDDAGKNTKISIYNADSGEAYVLLGKGGNNKHDATLKNEKLAIKLAIKLYPHAVIYSDSKWIVARLNLPNVLWISRKENKIADFLSKSSKLGQGILHKNNDVPVRNWLYFEVQNKEKNTYNSVFKHLLIVDS